MRVGKLNVVGGQVTFPATQNPSSDANTLDDYEEGTYTPVLKFGGATTGITYNTQLGYYTKIGNMVTVWVNIHLSSKGSATGSATITLPFTSSIAAIGSVSPLGVTFSDVPVIRVEATTAVADLRELTTVGSATDLADTDFANTSRVRFTMSYKV